MQEEAAERFEALAAEGEDLIPNEPMITHALGDAEDWTFFAWRTRCLTALRAYVPGPHPAAVEFEKEVAKGKQMPVTTGVGIMRGLASDARGGLLYQRATNLIAAEVFSDFLTMADHLAKANHYHAAASLTGAVLEDALRRLATNHKIKHGKRDGIDKLNAALSDSSVYTAIEQKQIDAWREIRNAADHGRFDDVQPEHVRQMVDGVSDFLRSSLR